MAALQINDKIPSLYEWMGGMDKFQQLTDVFYKKVLSDPLLEPIFRHLGRHLKEEHRRQWVKLLIDTADEIKLPDDPEFRSAFVAYVEWGTRIAVMTSNAEKPFIEDPDTPMPQWSWGVPGKPYTGE